LQSLPLIHPNAAGIDVGAKEHVVAVPADRDPEPVRSFKAFTPDLCELADWLKQCGVETVALESTGIYWITLYEILEERGFQVRVIHSTQSVRHMQKALFAMNVQLSNVISDIVGESGMRILEAILAGERDSEALATLCSTRIKASRQTVAKSLHGNWREELLFALRVALDSYRFAQSKIAECDERSLSNAALRAPRRRKGMAEYEIRLRLQRLKWLKREANSLDMQLLPA
jgi:transposase